MSGTPASKESRVKTGYASIKGLKMYYEIRGGGQPLVLLHGGFMTIDAMGPIVPLLAGSRQVIAVELEGHGRTADLDRPLSIEQMADDVAGLLDHLEIKEADVFGFSMGGMTALRLAMKHQDRVRKLVVVSAGYNEDSFYPSMRATWPDTTAESLAGSPMEEVYLKTAPDPKHWPVFVRKMMSMLSTFKGWSKEDVKSINAPTLLIVGDVHDIRPEHVVELFRLLGGAPEHSRFDELPEVQLAVFPGTTHFEIVYRTDLLAPTINQFLDASGPPAPGPAMRTGSQMKEEKR
jgi:pimeloyl-ACP methyl ester carboxylesterase